MILKCWKLTAMFFFFFFLCADSGSADMPMIWIFPYFFEPRILECLPSFAMLDYQVCWQYIPF